MERKKLVIFDLDGLLVDTERESIQIFKNAAEESGYQIDEKFFRRNMGKKQEGRIRDFILNLPEDQEKEIEKILIQKVLEKREEMIHTGVPLRPGALELLKELRRRNIQSMIASSSDSHYVNTLIKTCKIKDYFSDVVTGDDVQKGKPDPEVFLLSCERNHVDVHDTLVLEDSENGGLAAKAAGIDYIMVPDIAYVSEETKKHALAVAADLSEVIRYI